MTDQQTYMQQVYVVALMYNSDLSFGYDNAMCACRDVARDYKRQSDTVYADFEVACDVLKENK